LIISTASVQGLWLFCIDLWHHPYTIVFSNMLRYEYYCSYSSIGPVLHWHQRNSHRLKQHWTSEEQPKSAGRQQMSYSIPC